MKRHAYLRHVYMLSFVLTKHDGSGRWRCPSCSTLSRFNELHAVTVCRYSYPPRKNSRRDRDSSLCLNCLCLYELAINHCMSCEICGVDEGPSAVGVKAWAEWFADHCNSPLGWPTPGRGAFMRLEDYTEDPEIAGLARSLAEEERRWGDVDGLILDTTNTLQGDGSERTISRYRQAHL